MFKTPTPKKHLGQHFLINTQVITEVLQDIQPSPQDIFIEIGPGLGALTFPLLDYGVKLYAIELDTEVIPKLLAQANPKFHCIQADATVFDYNLLFQQQPQKLRMIGNLPYNVGTPIIFRLFDYIDQIQDMTFMLQKEVVDRMIAKPGSSDYGRLSMMTHYFCQAQALSVIPPQDFNPPPKVDSQFIYLTPRSQAERAKINPALLSTWVKRLFQFPRKTVTNNLKGYCSVPELEQAGIDPKARPQEISLALLIQLIDIMTRHELTKQAKH